MDRTLGVGVNNEKDPCAGCAAPRQPSVRAVARIPMTLRGGEPLIAEMITFRGLHDGLEHFAVRFGEPGDVPLVRLHSECMTGDVFGSARCDCGPQLHEAIRRLASAGGYLLYMRQEGRGIGLYEKIDAYVLQEQALDTFEANRAIGRGDDERDYREAAEMLRALGVTRISLLSNNPDKRAQLQAHGITVTQLVPTGVYVGPFNRQYLEAKVRHSQHTIVMTPAVPDGATQ